jgi:hypothetical protein
VYLAGKQVGTTAGTAYAAAGLSPNTSYSFAVAAYDAAGNTTVRGVVFPAGTNTVLFFGTQGTGPFCYGEGTDDPSLDGTPTRDGTTWCYDPDVSYKGTHGYPYVPEVWAYDAKRPVRGPHGREAALGGQAVRDLDARPAVRLTLDRGRGVRRCTRPDLRLAAVRERHGSGDPRLPRRLSYSFGPA